MTLPLWAHYLAECEKIGLYYQVDFDSQNSRFTVQMGAQPRTVAVFRSLSDTSDFFRGVAELWANITVAPSIGVERAIYKIGKLPGDHLPIEQAFTNREASCYYAALTTANDYSRKGGKK
jgi:hypothetical protein